MTKTFLVDFNSSLGGLIESLHDLDKTIKVELTEIVGERAKLIVNSDKREVEGIVKPYLC